MKSLLIALTFALSLSLTARAEERTPVLIELFTSQGCSSCPPADAELATLLREQPLAGIEVIGISQHVDYWNSLGWRDPFSDRRYSERQRDYARRLDSGVYTPQLIIDGRTELVGSRSADVRRAIRAAAAVSKLPLKIDLQDEVEGLLTLRLSVAAETTRPKRSQFWYALVEDRLRVAVESGENAGRGLAHEAVARTLEKLPRGSDRAEIELDQRWDRKHLRVVAFLVDSLSGQVLAAGSHRLE